MTTITFTKKSLDAMPTIFKGHDYDLKISTPTLQVSISHENVVTVRQLKQPEVYEKKHKAQWVITNQYEVK